MTLENIYYIGQTISVIAIVVSLVFVGLQVRQNTRATRAASHNAVSDSLNEINRMFVESSEITKIWITGLQDRQALNEEERWRLDSLLRAYFHVCETMYIQAMLGAGDKGIVFAEQDGIRGALVAPGGREWWDSNPLGFAPEFRDYVNGLAQDLGTAPTMATMLGTKEDSA